MSSVSKSEIGKPAKAGGRRVAVYIDGLNLYHGIRSQSLMRLQWLDIGALGANLLMDGQVLVGVNYFVARFVPGGIDDGMVERQDFHLQALRLDGRTQIIEGQFQTKLVRCRDCSVGQPTFVEKLTDVNIAVALLCDAEDDVYDVAIVVSGDADLSGPIKTARQRHPDKTIIVAFPPNRRSMILQRAASGHISVSPDILRNSQLPDAVRAHYGYILRRPDSWK